MIAGKVHLYIGNARENGPLWKEESRSLESMGLFDLSEWPHLLGNIGKIPSAE